MARDTSPGQLPAAAPALDDVIQRRPTVLSAEIDGEVVALDAERGVCYGLDPVGARIWALIASPVTPLTLCEQLIAEYAVDPATCRADVLALLADLRAEGLIAVARDGAPSA